MSERDEFEAWAKRDGFGLERNHFGDYERIATRGAWDAWQAARATPQQAMPEGWKLVPLEPTKEMWDAVNRLDDQMAAGGYDGKGCSIEQAWDCLLAAAPQPSQEPEKAVWLALRRLIYAIERVDACINEAGSVLSAALDERAAALNHARGFIPNPQPSRYQD